MFEIEKQICSEELGEEYRQTQLYTNGTRTP